MAGRSVILATLCASFAVATSGALLAGQHQTKQELFQTSDRCFACHNTLSTRGGEDVSFGTAWRATMMANSARDPYWQAGVRRESMDHPESQKVIEGECSKCHMPMASVQSRFAGDESKVFAHLDFSSGDRIDRLARDGVSCSLCHQIRAENLGTRESFVGGFVIDTSRARGERQEFGPYPIENGDNRVMRSSSGGYRPTEGPHIRQSELCATCHTLITTALGPGGQKVGELPEQMPYQEWLASDLRDSQSCQHCHMPVINEPVRMTSVLGRFREGVSRHVFVGGNFFMQRVLNRHRGELGVEALPQELEAAASRSVEHLQSKTAEVSIERLDATNGRLSAEIAIRNLAGHKFPTAYPSRRAWLHVTIKDGHGIVVFESGSLRSDGSIAGNDNDDDARTFEPHYVEITRTDQVQIYEDIMVGVDDVPTTGLLTAVRYIKDNRLLPAGFDKRSVGAEITPRGEAMDDEDFRGGSDRVRVEVSVTQAQGPFTMETELWFQPVSFRWIQNLKGYNAAEPQRFVRYYEAMSSGSAIVVSRAASLLNYSSAQ